MQPQPMDLSAYLQRVQQQMNAVQVQALRARQLAMGVRVELDLKRQGHAPPRPVEFTSQFGEDLVLWSLLGGQREGFFIEAGAFDGYRYSVTYALECIGWRGLLVEPLPEPAEQCRQGRPASRVVQAALAQAGSGTEATFTVLEDQYGGMLSYLKTTEQHLRDTNWASRRTITVPVTTLNDLLADHAGGIDAVSLDVEGAELDVLKGFDLNRFRPRIVVLEDNSQGRDPGVANHMSRFPYQLAYRFAVNNVYVRNDEKEILGRAKWLLVSG